MATTTGQTMVEGVEEVNKTFVKREGRFLFFFKTEWWEEVKAEHIANDIHITTSRDIREVYLNGKPLINSQG